MMMCWSLCHFQHGYSKADVPMLNNKCKQQAVQANIKQHGQTANKQASNKQQRQIMNNQESNKLSVQQPNTAANKK
jgi:hypothetical protein